MTSQITWFTHPNDVWETSAEIPYWWRDTTEIWVVTLHQYGIKLKEALFARRVVFYIHLVFFPRERQRGSRDLIFPAFAGPPLQRKEDNDYFLFLSSYASFIILLLQVLFVKLKEFEIRAKKDDNFSVWFVQSLWIATENTCRVSYVFYLVSKKN